MSNPSHKIAIGTSTFGKSSPLPLELLRKAGCSIELNPYERTMSEDEIKKHLQGIDGLIAGLEPLNESVLSESKTLKVISRVGVGTSNIDFDAARRRNIEIFSTPDAPTEAVAEFTVGAIINLTRRLLGFNSNLKEGNWKKSFTPGLSNTPVLIIGFGRIGKSVAQKLKVFNAQILVYDPYIKAGHEDFDFVSLEEGLARAKVITVHASGESQLLGPSEFSLMKNTPYLINAARGKLIHEESLLKALHSGTLSGAWIDVFAKEPYTGPLLEQPSCFVSPHISGYTPQARLNMEVQAVENLLRGLGINN